ncbi:hypothetical protein GCM10009654_16310 [Streptomyces hebeiensis]|uniref:Uncharacterized protein n=1 Tax=Streptomyces hebeiensis TaxID=229486 RepID=A0ABN1URF8_9ACTN
MTRSRVSFAASLVGLLLVVPGAAGSVAAPQPADVSAKKSWYAEVSCATHKITNNKSGAYVRATGRAKTEPLAIKNAKKNANADVPKGYKLGHCDVKKTWRR